MQRLHYQISMALVSLRPRNVAMENGLIIDDHFCAEVRVPHKIEVRRHHELYRVSFAYFGGEVGHVLAGMGPAKNGARRRSPFEIRVRFNMSLAHRVYSHHESLPDIVHGVGVGEQLFVASVGVVADDGGWQ